MKNIMIKIIGRQFFGDNPEDKMEFVTEGKLYKKNDSTYLVYDESEVSGQPGCKTTLKMSGDVVKMRRLGDAVGYGSEIIFEEGKRFTGEYETPYGLMKMEVLTNSIRNNLTEDGLGDIDIDYQVSLKGMAEGRNILNIHIM